MKISGSFLSTNFTHHNSQHFASLSLWNTNAILCGKRITRRGVVFIHCSSYKSINYGILLRWRYFWLPRLPVLPKLAITLETHNPSIYNIILWFAGLMGQMLWILRTTCKYTNIKRLNVTPKLFSSCNGALKSPCIKLNSRVHFAAIKQENNFMKTFL